MSLRISSLGLAAMMLAGCGSASAGPEGETIECAIGPGSEFTAVCTLERVAGDRFTIHHPDGGFRRFALDAEGEVALADSADELATSLTPCDDRQLIEWEAAGDRYRMAVGDVPRLPDE